MNKRVKKLLIIVIILGVIITGIAVFFILNSTPDELSEAEKEKAVAEILGRKPNLNPEIKAGDVIYTGEKLSFSYPARAEIYEYESPGKVNNTSEIDSFSFDIENPRLILNYSASNKPGLKSLDDEPGVKLREDAARGYIRSNVEIDGVTGQSYKKDSGGGERAEHTAYFLKDGVLYTISVSGASLEDSSELLEQIISSASFTH